MKKIAFLFAFMFICGIAFAQNQASTTTIDTNLKEYVGTYKFSETLDKCSIVLKDGDLYAEIDQYGQYKLVPQGVDKFKSTSSYGTVYTFLRNDEKAVDKLKAEVMGNELIAKKEKQ